MLLIEFEYNITKLTYLEYIKIIIHTNIYENGCQPFCIVALPFENSVVGIVFVEFEFFF